MHVLASPALLLLDYSSFPPLPTHWSMPAEGIGGEPLTQLEADKTRLGMWHIRRGKRLEEERIGIMHRSGAWPSPSLAVVCWSV